MSDFTHELLYFTSELSKIIFHIGVLYFIREFVVNNKKEREE